MKNSFSKILKQLRLEKGMRQQDLAEKLDTTQRNISYWESGSVQPDIDMLWQIADFFGITVDVLIGRRDY